MFKPLAFWWIQRSCWSTSQLVKAGMKMPLTLATLAYIWARHKWTESSSIAMAIGMLGILKMRQTPKGNSTMSEDTRCSAIESPFQHPIDPMVDDSTYPTSKTDLGFMIVMNKCKPWLWSRPFALLDLAWNLHTLFKEPPAISSWKVTSSKLTVSAPQKTQICVYFSRCFQVFPNSEDVHLCFIYPSKQTQVYCQRKGAEHANARGLSIVCWEKSQLKLTTVKVMFW